MMGLIAFFSVTILVWLSAFNVDNVPVVIQIGTELQIIRLHV